MKMHYRLNKYALLREALREFNTELDLFLRPLECSRNDEIREWSIFRISPFTSEELISKYSPEEMKQLCIEIDNEISSEECLDVFEGNDKSVYEFAFEYFKESSSWKEFKLNKGEKWQELEENIKSGNWRYCIRLLSNVIGYLPSTITQVSRVADIVPVNEMEKELLSLEDVQSLQNYRDKIFASRFFDSKSTLSGKSLPIDSLKARKNAKIIFFYFYGKLIDSLSLAVKDHVLFIEEIIGQYWEIIKSKKKRTTYNDEWGVQHEEGWIKELEYFIERVVSPRVVVDDDLIYRLGVDEWCLWLLKPDYPEEEFIMSLSLAPPEDIENRLTNSQYFDNLQYYKNKWLVSLSKVIIEVRLLSERTNHENEKVAEKEGNARGDLVDENVDEESEYKNIGVEYEFFVKDLLEANDYKIELTPTTGDQGVDIIAIRNGKKIAIQCKSYSSLVGNTAIQEVISGKLFYDCEIACVITNSSFTRSAMQLANKAGVILCSYNDLRPLIL
ncbi:MAG: hypothetical protein CVV46_03765 [Spirochaetae bacterium HGW-Spirochaetae-2]|jgi:HJR/Mrr/RecB family endonuclease|nr:MAG: hypothetical protein CVV46_03765 [Spirochaetae bacterium HGW-Spirochaetae-2]